MSANKVLTQVHHILERWLGIMAACREHGSLLNQLSIYEHLGYYKIFTLKNNERLYKNCPQ